MEYNNMEFTDITYLSELTPLQITAKVGDIAISFALSPSGACCSSGN